MSYELKQYKDTETSFTLKDLTIQEENQYYKTLLVLLRFSPWVGKIP